MTINLKRNCRIIKLNSPRVNLPNKTILVFEDSAYVNFFPITLSRPVCHLLAGTKTSLQRVRAHFPDCDVKIVCRPYLRVLFDGLSDESIKGLEGDIVLVNGSAVLHGGGYPVEEFKRDSGFTAFVDGEKLLMASIPGKKIKELAPVISRLYEEGKDSELVSAVDSKAQVDMMHFRYIWDAMLQNPLLIQSDFNEYYRDNNPVIKIGDANVYESESIMAPGDVTADYASVVDARGGPIIIESGVEIKPFCYLEGPAYIGRNCKLVGGKTTGGCSFGPGCRIGGEVENSVIIGNSNKYHEGFLGHAYLGEWVNLGALTTNSDLKNNYGEISVKINGSSIKTGSIKIGSFIGDHSKTGIGITLNTGINIGYSCNLFGGGLILEKEIPSFAWGNDTLRVEYSRAKAISTARTVMGRREHNFDERHEKLFEELFIRSKETRGIWLKGRRH
ncbi:MAG: hypothetical protein GF307_00630 [candidate division Zixibacteria bacterium]|nr:hypothetical protein [candidate division Zixibacteria bacterium]